MKWLLNRNKLDIEIWDERRAKTRRKEFHYVLDGNTLFHVSKYSTKSEIEKDGKEEMVKYTIPLENIGSKLIYQFGFSNSGGFHISKYASEEFLKEKDRKFEIIKPEEFNLNLEIKDQKTKSLVDEIHSIYKPMVEEVTNFMKSMTEGNIMPASPRVKDYFYGGANYTLGSSINFGLASSLCHDEEKSRQGSIKGVMKFLHQWWTIKVLHEVFGVVEIKDKKFHWSEQGESYPISIFKNAKNEWYTCWHELQIVCKPPEGYQGPLSVFFFEKPTVWLRADIVVCRGQYQNAKEITEFVNKSIVDLVKPVQRQSNSSNEIKKFDYLIECKHRAFDDWWADGAVIDKELKPYKTIFKAENPILLSLKPIPQLAKDKIQSEGYFVVDEFYPGGKGLKEFIDFIGKKAQ